MRAIGHVAFSSLPSSNRISTDYIEHPERLKGLYSWDFRNDADWKKVAALRSIPHRQDLSRILLEQNQLYGASKETLEAVRRIEKNSTFVVTTGQQLSIYGGCLFYFYKTITAIKLAQKLSALLGVDVVPIFWMEGEDHDLPEVDHLYLPGDELPLHRLGGIAPGRQPISTRALPADIEAFHSDIIAHLPRTDFMEPLAQQLGSFYQPGRNWVEAFGRLWSYLFPGLVLLNPSDPGIKKLARPIFQQEVQRGGKIIDVTAARDRDLENIGYDVQVRTGYPNFFWTRDGERQAVRHSEGRFFLAENDTEITADLGKLDCFSPKVLLRPVVQDFLLPNLATITGPGEIAYFAQAEALYAAHGITPSVVYPRAAATILEKAALKLFAGSPPVTLDLLAKGPAAVFDRLRKAHPEEALFASALDAIHTLETDLHSIATEADTTLVGAIDTAREKIVYQITNLKNKFNRARYQRDEVLTRRIESACAQCFPLGTPQERVIAGIYYLAKYGLPFLEELHGALDIGDSMHKVLAID